MKQNTYQMQWINNVMGVSWNAWAAATGTNAQPTQGSFETYPGDTLVTAQEMVYTVNGAFLAAGNLDINSGWTDGTVAFAVRIVVPPQVFDMGNRPYYQVAYTTDPNSTPQFEDVVDDPAYPYTLNFTTSWGDGTLTITSTSEHDGLALDCIIE
ncbi:hypothetical protein [Yoonia sp. I 8.24]|uniref:hypothetical protein n=1 Tax=Yoonia sp. I 8.24 TaxID=1537229 RepID=UPI001EE0850B|nr:hypothetical protein [Yoonia sp. I 8.24]MCG3266132.1 hypothetical protein [Yoonia sp. I 8.24]